MSDTTQKVKSRKQFEELSKTDELGTLNNPRELFEKGELWLEENRANETKIALLFFDIDLFKILMIPLGITSVMKLFEI